MSFIKKLTGKEVSKSSSCCGVELTEVLNTQKDSCCGSSETYTSCCGTTNEQQSSCC